MLPALRQRLWRLPIAAPPVGAAKAMAYSFRSASQHAVVVCDRSVLDNYAYMVLACGRQKPIERFVDHWIRTYDLLFKVPITGTVAADGVRDTDEFFMRSIDQLVDTLLAEKKIPHERLAPGQRDTWIEVVREKVRAAPELAKRLF